MIDRVGRVVYLYVGPDPLVPSEMEALVRDPSAGATVTFTGIVRQADEDRQVVSLEYEAHPDAAAVLGRLAAELLDAHPEVVAVAAAHRTGALDVGEVAFVACVSSAHRREGFEACAALVDAVKEALPMWKRQIFTDGDEWVNAL